MTTAMAHAQQHEQASATENYFTIATPVGTWQVITRGDALSSFEFCPPKNLPAKKPQSDFEKALYQKLTAYLNGQRVDFKEIPLYTPSGSPFHQKVWQALREIPYGETRTYADIAEAVGSPAAFRAVGSANSRNPIPVVIPCHRVVGKDGSLRGFMGGHPQGMKIKEFLLGLEQVTNNSRLGG